MAIPIPTFTDFDASIWLQELEDFVPESVVDAHTHIWNERFAGSHVDPNFVLRMEVSLDDLHTWSRRLLPGRNLGYVVLPSPMVGIDYSGHNDWTASQVAEYPTCHQGFPVASGTPLLLEAAMLVYPGLTPVEVAAHHEHWGVRILKPYRVFAADPSEARIADYLPLPIMEVADRFKMAVVLHLSKRNGPADEDNIRDLERYSHEFPHITWILAHCARAFNAVHLERVIQRYAAIESVYVDTSAVNDTYTHYLLFKHFDRQRILFGSDDIAAGGYRGKYITFGNGWKAFHQEDPLEHCDARCTFVIYEQLRCQRQAAAMAGLTRSEIEAIFAGNAIRLCKQL
jgi:predicted TIM-barrel fold metal-dependent hydrolase